MSSVKWQPFCYSPEIVSINKYTHMNKQTHRMKHYDLAIAGDENFKTFHYVKL